MGTSKKHHYIPQFYLKGFTDPQGQYFLYDKETDKIWKTNPLNSFAENYRNTGSIPGDGTKPEQTDMVERMLTHIDTTAAASIDLFRTANSETKIDKYRLLDIQIFIATLFWRVPANDLLREKIFETHAFSQLGFGVFHKETGERSEEIENTLKGIESFQKAYQVFLAIRTFLGLNEDNVHELQIYYRENDHGIITDNPVLIQQYEDFKSLKSELIVPLSASFFMILTKKNKPSTLLPYTDLLIDILLFLNAKRFIACQNKEYLEVLIGEYKSHKDVELQKKKLFAQVLSAFD